MSHDVPDIQNTVFINEQWCKRRVALPSLYPTFVAPNPTWTVIDLPWHLYYVDKSVEVMPDKLDRCVCGVLDDGTGKVFE